MKQRSVCIAPLDWGLGHATRCVPIIHSFQQLGYKVYIASDGHQAALLQEACPEVILLKLTGYHVKYTKEKKFLMLSLLSQLPKIIFKITYEYFWLKRVQNKFQFDLIISDNRFGFYHTKTPSVFITHQLNLQTPFTWTSKLYERILYQWLKKFDACWIPDMQTGTGLAGSLAHPQKLPQLPLWYMGILSRLYQAINASSNQVAPENEFLGIVSGPEPQRTLLENTLWTEGNELNKNFVLVAGLPKEKLYHKKAAKGTLYHHLAADALSAQIQNANYIICRGGYTTLMELAPYGKKLILVPTPGQTEQEYLAHYWSEKKWAIACPQTGFNLQEALATAANTEYQQPGVTFFSTQALATELKRPYLFSKSMH